MNKIMNKSIRCSLIATLALFTMHAWAAGQTLSVEVSSVQNIQKKGRLYIVFSPSKKQEPRKYSAWPTQNVEPLFARDITSMSANQSIVFDPSSKGFPHETLAQLPAGTWYVQAVYDTDFLDSRINSPLNFYSDVVEVIYDGKSKATVQLSLLKQLENEQLPEQDRFLKFDKLPSQLLSEFWQADMFLRVGVILPKSYYDEPSATFPVVFNIGGYHARYSRAEQLYKNEDFKQYWFGDDAPQMVMVFLDGEAPLGDSYQIDSKNNGPYGEANIVELLPFLTSKYRLKDSANSRFLSGCSTGGWVSLALQLYYPDTFNGAWSFSADGVDFRYFQLVDIYKDKNAFVNEHGNKRPSFRAKDGEIIFSIEREIMMENMLGRNESFAFSGGQWGGWNAVFGPKKADGEPSTIWDPATGLIDKSVAEEWEHYDLRKYTEENWSEIGPKLAGKLHIWMGDMDNFYLNNAMKLYQDMLLAQKNPVSDAAFTWERNTGHCDYKRIPMLQKTLSQMQQRLN